MSDGPLPTHKFIDPAKVPHQAAIQALVFERSEALNDYDESDGTYQGYRIEELDQMKKTIELLCAVRDGDKIIADKPEEKELTCRFCEHVVTLQPNGAWITVDTGVVCVENEGDVHAPEDPDEDALRRMWDTVRRIRRSLHHKHCG